MPTSRPRHQVTETDELAAALEAAERRWPGKSRSALIAALAEEGAKALEREEADQLAVRRRLVEANAGGFEFGEGYLEDLREDWPA